MYATFKFDFNLGVKVPSISDQLIAQEGLISTVKDAIWREARIIQGYEDLTEWLDNYDQVYDTSLSSVEDLFGNVNNSAAPEWRRNPFLSLNDEFNSRCVYDDQTINDHLQAISGELESIKDLLRSENDDLLHFDDDAWVVPENDYFSPSEISKENGLFMRNEKLTFYRSWLGILEGRSNLTVNNVLTIIDWMQQGRRLEDNVVIQERFANLKEIIQQVRVKGLSFLRSEEFLSDNPECILIPDNPNIDFGNVTDQWAITGFNVERERFFHPERFKF